MRNSEANRVRHFADPLRPRFLVIGVDWLGDALFMTPLFRALKQRWPESFVAVTTASRNLDVLSRCGYVDQVRAYDEVPFLLGLSEQHHLKKWIKSNRFDTALFLHRSFTRALAVRLAGVPQRIGWGGSKGDRFMTDLLNPPPSTAHRIDRYLSVLKPLNLPVSARNPEVQSKPEDVREWRETRAAHTGWQEGDSFVVLHPGGNWDLKRWPVGHFAEIARRFVAAGQKVAVCGSPREAALGANIQEAGAAQPGSIVSFCGKTSFAALVGMLSGARILLSNDSGPLHLAAALGTQVVGLFGPTLESLTGPVTNEKSRAVSKDFGCELPCYFTRCANRVCLDRLAVDEVWAAANDLLSGPVQR
ncbi:MAG: lipopolysaccharide heptosyltransferase II [Candidatus Omnitrophica bacterium]|jgi:lipopolysaccharide heptosyltransferase II|nr:lipopolysaccharide heptosyltransferase II [Candidatus Omnitrophota bacterium]